MKTTIIRQLRGIIAIAAVAVLLAGCAAPEKQAADELISAIQPPFAELVPQFTDYTLNAAEGDTFFAPSGTRIIIPPHALVDDSGKVVTGEATIKYREYHDALDVFLSGIPMDYMSQGERRNMQTAGMFEIRAEQNGRELQLAAGRKAEVGFASQEGGADYNFFRFDETNDKWAFSDYSEATPNPEYAAIQKRIAERKPIPKVPFGKDHFVLNYGAFLDIFYKDNWNKVRSNINNPVMKNKAKKYGLKMYDIYGGIVTFKGTDYPAAMMVWKNLSGKGFPKWTDKRRCVAKRIKGNVYRLTVKDKRKGKEVSIDAECVMLLRHLFIASPEQWMKNHEDYMKQIAEDEKRLELEAEVFRSVNLSGFGIFNIDKLRKRGNMLAITASFVFEGKQKKSRLGTQEVYCFPGDDKTVIKISADGVDQLYLDPKEKHFRIIAVLDGNRVATFSSKRYKKIDFKALERSLSSKYTFVLQAQQGVITSKKDLKKLLNI